MKARTIVAGVFIAIPFAVLLSLPLYNVTAPELSGIPFFYWWQTLWLALSAGLFLGAAVLIDWDRTEA